MGLRVELVIAAALVAVAGCGSGTSGEASCMLSTGLPDAGVGLALCQEYTGLTSQDVANLRQACMVPSVDGGGSTSAHFENGPCSRVGAIGGCRTVAGRITATNWYYDDGSGAFTPEDIQMLCASAGLQFIPP